MDLFAFLLAEWKRPLADQSYSHSLEHVIQNKTECYNREALLLFSIYRQSCGSFPEMPPYLYINSNILNNLQVLHNNITYFWLGKQEWFDSYIRIQSFQVMITKSTGYSYSGKNSTLKWTTVKAKIWKSKTAQICELRLVWISCLPIVDLVI